MAKEFPYYVDIMQKTQPDFVSPFADLWEMISLMMGEISAYVLYKLDGKTNHSPIVLYYLAKSVSINVKSPQCSLHNLRELQRAIIDAILLSQTKGTVSQTSPEERNILEALDIYVAETIREREL